MSGPCLSSSVTGRPLRPATRRCLGEPLPHQQADRPRAHPEVRGPKVPPFNIQEMPLGITYGIRPPFGGLSPASGQVAHVLLTRSPLDLAKQALLRISFDLHVLSTPPAFVLSQNQTLRRNFDWLDRCSKQLPKLTCRGVVKLLGPARWRTNHAAHNLALSFHPANLIEGYPEASSDVRRRAGPTLLKSFSIVGTKKPTGLASRSTS